jgi:hypothetical protein
MRKTIDRLALAPYNAMTLYNRCRSGRLIFGSISSTAVAAHYGTVADLSRGRAEK